MQLTPCSSCHGCSCCRNCHPRPPHCGGPQPAMLTRLLWLLLLPRLLSFFGPYSLWWPTSCGCGCGAAAPAAFASAAAATAAIAAELPLLVLPLLPVPRHRCCHCRCHRCCPRLPQPPSHAAGLLIPCSQTPASQTRHPASSRCAASCPGTVSCRAAPAGRGAGSRHTAAGPRTTPAIPGTGR